MSRAVFVILALLCCGTSSLAADYLTDTHHVGMAPLPPSSTLDIDLANYSSEDSQPAAKSDSCQECGNHYLCSCRCACPIVPSMIGDTGLLDSRMNVAIANTQAFFHNHIYKVAENNAVTPQDRIGFNFNYLSGVFSGGADGTPVIHDLFEYRFFAEKTIFNSDLSVDLMIPFYYTSEYDQGDLSIALNGSQTRPAFGDLAFGMKYLLFRNQHAALSAGLRAEAPTNDQIVETHGTNVFYTTFDDDVWHFTPYAAMMLTPSDRLFVQSFLSYRLNTGSLDREPPFDAIREQTFLMADLSVGYWLYRNPGRRGLTGLVPTVELHYTGSYDEESPANTVNNLLIGHTDVLNLTAGVTAFFNNRLSMTAGAAVPLRDNPTNNSALPTFGSDRRYDWSLLVNVNYYFGR